jgi:hypothetical protein
MRTTALGASWNNHLQSLVLFPNHACLAVVRSDCTQGFMSERAFKVGDRVRLKTEWPPRIATVVELLEGAWVLLQWEGPSPGTFSCTSEDITHAREAPPPPK